MRIKKGLFPSRFLKLILAGVIGVLGGILVITSGNLPETETGQLPPAPPQAVNKIEISADKKSIIDAETKKLLFKISEAQSYIKDYFKNRNYEYAPGKFIPITDAKYAGDCFGDAVLSNDKELIVFSTSCIDDTTMNQPWIGTVNHKLLPLMYEGETAPEPRRFLSGGIGQNFSWSSDDNTITYETPSLLSLPPSLEKRTIDAKTGEILELKDIYHESTPSPYYWDTYQNYNYGFEVKYPSDWERTIPTGTSIATFINKPNTGNIDLLTIKFIEIKSEKGFLEEIKKITDNKKVKINEQEFYFFKNSENLTAGFLFNEYYTERDNKNFSIVTGIVFKQEGGYIIPPLANELLKQQDIFNRILSSFKFIKKAETDDWNIYRNDKYSYEIKYPNGWNMNDEEGIIITFYDKKYKTAGDALDNKNVIQVRVIDRKDGADYFERFKQKNNPELKKINNIDFYFLKSSMAGLSFYEYYAYRDGKIFTIALDIISELPQGAKSESDIKYPTEAELANELNILNQMLSTFQFVERKANQ